MVMVALELQSVRTAVAKVWLESAQEGRSEFPEDPNWPLLT